MAIRSILYILFFSWSTSLFSQQLEWGSPQKVKQKSFYNQVLGESNGAVFLLRSKDSDFKQELVIERYKSNLSLEISIQLPLSVNGSVERVLLFPEQILVFISARNTATNKIDLLVQSMDLNFKIQGNPQVLCSIPQESFLEKRHIQVKPNAARSLFGIMYLSQNNKRESVLHLFAFDLRFQQKFGKQFGLGEEERSTVISAYDLSNTGESFLLIDFPKKEGGRNNDERKYFLYGYYPISDQMMEYDLEGTDSMRIEDLGMTLNNVSKTVAVSGLWSPLDKKATRGYFYRRISFQSGQVEFSNQQALNDAFFSSLSTAKLDRFDPDLNDFYIRKLISRSDGGLMLIAEKYVQTRQTYTYYVNNFPQTSTRVIYSFDEVIVLSIDPAGILQFHSVVKKNQSSVGDGGYYSSFITIPTLDQVHILFNTEGDEETDIGLQSISYRGQSENRILIKKSNTNASIIPGEYKLVSANSAIVCAIRDKRFTLMRISF